MLSGRLSRMVYALVVDENTHKCSDTWVYYNEIALYNNENFLTCSRNWKLITCTSFFWPQGGGEGREMLFIMHACNNCYNTVVLMLTQRIHIVKNCTKIVFWTQNAFEFKNCACADPINVSMNINNFKGSVNFVYFSGLSNWFT